MICLSGFQVGELLAARARRESTALVSLDLGRTKTCVGISGDCAELPDGARVSFADLEKIAGGDSCYFAEGGGLLKIQFFNPAGGGYFRLVASGPDTPPTAEISGVRMHQTKNMDPAADTKAKLDSIGPVSGRVLDTSTGLGYTAIEALKAGASEVYTVEKDEAMMRLCEINPWSRELSDARIRKIRGDVYEVIGEFKGGFFDAVVHDPPRLTLAGSLYSLEFYRQLYRVLKAGGRMFHYVGSPGGRYRGKTVEKGVAERLLEAGFRKVRRSPEALGVSAEK